MSITAAVDRGYSLVTDDPDAPTRWWDPHAQRRASSPTTRQPKNAATLRRRAKNKAARKARRKNRKR